MGQIVAIANQKGGVGKTTTAISLAAGLALAGKKTLLVDFDPQSNSTRALGFGPDSEEPSIYDLFSGTATLDEIPLPTRIEGFALIPSEPDLVGLEIELTEEAGRESRLKTLLAGARDSNDFVLIDCPPSLSLLTLNALVAADSVLVPVQCEYLALEGITLLVDTISRVKDSLNSDLRIQGIVLTMFDDRTNLSKQVVEDIRAFFGDSVYETIIPRNIRLGEAPSHGLPIFLYEPRSRGAEAYRALAEEFLRREQAWVTTQPTSDETVAPSEQPATADPTEADRRSDEAGAQP